MTQRMIGHAGEQALAALRPFGVDVMFTLNGGHVWPLYEAARNQGVRVVDTRHEQTATFAAEGYAKLTRTPGLAVLTAGPGITNGVSAITTAYFNGSPLVVLGGRAPQRRWGSGSLQELEHVPIVASITKSAGTVFSPELAAKQVHEAAAIAVTPHRGPVFLDFPLDVFGPAEAELPDPVRPSAEPPTLTRSPPSPDWSPRPSGRPSSWAATCTGTGAWDALRAAVEHLRVPCWFNGLGRGCLPADHELAFTRTRGLLKTEADLVVVVGTPLDFRLGFGRFGSAAVAHVVDAPSGRAGHVEVATAAGDLAAIFDGLAAYAGDRSDHEPWITKVRDAEAMAASGDVALLGADADPIKPTRVYGELAKRLERDAVVICDGGDFASYAGKYVEVFTARVLARHRAVRVPRQRSRLCDRRPCRAPAVADRAAARRRCRRLQPDGRRTASCATASRSSWSWGTTACGGWRSTRCRPSTAGTSPATCSPVAATTRSCERSVVPVRRHPPRRGRCRARPGLRLRRALPRQRRHRPERRLPPLVQPGVGGMPSAVEARAAELRRRLERLERALDPVEADDRETYDRLQAIVAYEVARVRQQIDQIDALAMADPPGAWAKVAELDDRTRRLAGEVLAFSGGVGARRAGLDDGLCAAADQLLDEVADQILVSTRGVTLPAPGEYLDLLSGVIRVRYPAGGVWDLPMALHELGHHVAPLLGANRPEGPPVKAIVTRERQTSAPLANFAEELFADTFATYVAGPAYGYSCLLLRLPPSRAHQDVFPTHPAPVKRAVAVLTTLASLQEAFVRSKHASGSLQPAIDDLGAAWSQLLESAGGPGQPAQEAADYARSLTAELIAVLDGEPVVARFAGLAPSRAVLPAVQHGVDPPPGARMVDALNAGWMVRRGAELEGRADRVAAITAAVTTVCARITGGA